MNMQSRKSGAPRGQGHRNPAEDVHAFMTGHRLGISATDRLLGFNSKGRSARRWVENGLPPHVHTLMAFVDYYGADIAERIASERDAVLAAARDTQPDDTPYWVQPVSSNDFKVPAARVVEWRAAHGLLQRDVDRLFGFTAGGRSCRTWEDRGAPSYAEVFMAYVDAHGTALAMALVDERGQDIPLKRQTESVG